MTFGEITDVNEVMNNKHFKSNPADIQIQINREIQIGIPDHF